MRQRGGNEAEGRKWRGKGRWLRGIFELIINSRKNMRNLDYSQVFMEQ